ncbi:MAG: radical SAM protein [Gammaproteobacteria bacterium]|nr:radical SAM protein [Gammaproteobacteria bacterium]
MTAGCGLRCKFCYRSENLAAEAGDSVTPEQLAGWIDAADDVEHVHFVGGNPDESLPAILDALAQVHSPAAGGLEQPQPPDTRARSSCSKAWSTALSPTSSSGRVTVPNGSPASATTGPRRPRRSGG